MEASLKPQSSCSPISSTARTMQKIQARSENRSMAPLPYLCPTMPNTLLATALLILCAATLHAQTPTQNCDALPLAPPAIKTEVLIDEEKNDTIYVKTYDEHGNLFSWRQTDCDYDGFYGPFEKTYQYFDDHTLKSSQEVVNGKEITSVEKKQNAAGQLTSHVIRHGRGLKKMTFKYEGSEWSERTREKVKNNGQYWMAKRARDRRFVNAAGQRVFVSERSDGPDGKFPHEAVYDSIVRDLSPDGMPLKSSSWQKIGQLNDDEIKYHHYYERDSIWAESGRLTKVTESYRHHQRGLVNQSTTIHEEGMEFPIEEKTTFKLGESQVEKHPVSMDGWELPKGFQQKPALGDAVVAALKAQRADFTDSIDTEQGIWTIVTENKQKQLTLTKGSTSIQFQKQKTTGERYYRPLSFGEHDRLSEGKPDPLNQPYRAIPFLEGYVAKACQWQKKMSFFSVTVNQEFDYNDEGQFIALRFKEVNKLPMSVGRSTFSPQDGLTLTERSGLKNRPDGATDTITHVQAYEYCHQQLVQIDISKPKSKGNGVYEKYGELFQRPLNEYGLPTSFHIEKGGVTITKVRFEYRYH